MNQNETDNRGWQLAEAFGKWIRETKIQPWMSPSKQDCFIAGYTAGQQSILKRTCAGCEYSGCYIQQVVSKDDKNFSCNKYVQRERHE